MLVAGKLLYNICHSRTQLINEIVNEIEMHKWRKLAAGEFFLQYLCTSYCII